MRPKLAAAQSAEEKAQDENTAHVCLNGDLRAQLSAAGIAVAEPTGRGGETAHAASADAAGHDRDHLPRGTTGGESSRDRCPQRPCV